MKTLVAILLLMSATLIAGYDFEIKDGDWFEAQTLTGTQSMLVTGGGIIYLSLIKVLHTSKKHLFFLRELEEFGKYK
jgi:hypothetical protein